MEITDQEFNDLIIKAMNELPQKYIKGLDNVAILYDDEPTDYQREISKLKGHSLLLGLYEGIPLTSRGSNYSHVLPDKITLFKNALIAVSNSLENFYENIKRTLWHEMAHFYGLSHEDMDERMSRTR